VEKMDGQVQSYYQRKNWSSVILWNCDHPAHKRLTLELLNSAPGRDLHRFCWLKDEEIGSLAPRWNYLVDVEPRPSSPAIYHFTLGGPWFDKWAGGSEDKTWYHELQLYNMFSKKLTIFAPGNTKQLNQ
jgi:hypothetical protein